MAFLGVLFVGFLFWVICIGAIVGVLLLMAAMILFVIYLARGKKSKPLFVISMVLLSIAVLILSVIAFLTFH